MMRTLQITRQIQEWLHSIMPETAANIVEMVLVAIVYLLIFAVAGLF